jgi:hypothetical protein
MTTIQRWACACGSDGSPPQFIPDPTGGWVSFEDHINTVAVNERLRAMLVEARAELELAALRTGAPYELLRGMTDLIDRELR